MRFSQVLVLAVLGLPVLASAQQDSEITYNGEVARIINENCVICHQEGGIGPMQFENYDQVRPWAPLIQFRVANREMPPYAYDHGIGLQDLKGDWRPVPGRHRYDRRLGRSGRAPQGRSRSDRSRSGPA